MAEYGVVWEIGISASSPVEAARKAQSIQRDPQCWANVFIVDDEIIDLDDLN